ncbi:MAG: hypothetical protein KC561_18745, partial [Myxococcales bacterium]|nr:hypothetical protein [Myxococcales bacterium]
MSVTEVAGNTAFEYDVLWRYAAAQQDVSRIRPQFPDHCQQLGARRTALQGESLLTTYRLSCTNDLRSDSIAIQGLEASLADVVATFRPSDGENLTTVLSPEAPAFQLDQAAEPDGANSNFVSYLSLGVAHILGGADHLLFVLALLLLVKGRRRLL